MKFKAQEKNFSKCFDDAVASLKTQQESHPKSAILETLGFVHEVLKSDPSATKRIVLYSDMLQNSDTLSFLKASTVDIDAALKVVDKESLLYPLSNIGIYVAGAGLGVPDQKARRIEQFWQTYFKKAGATLKFYGPLLVAS
jgi:DNA topoisomerase VI subunit A